MGILACASIINPFLFFILEKAQPTSEHVQTAFGLREARVLLQLLQVSCLQLGREVVGWRGHHDPRVSWERHRPQAAIASLAATIPRCLE